MNLQAFCGTFHDRGATRLLLFLVCGDLAFGVLHVVNNRTDLLNIPRLDIMLDQSYPEMFQYLKYAWCCILLTVASFRYTAWRFMAWAALFLYFLLDDSLRVHERLGRHVAMALDFQPAWGLRLQDYGEMLVSAFAGLGLFLPLGLAYRTGSGQFKKLSRDLALLVLALVFVGVFVDMAQMAFRPYVGPTINSLLRALEDLGEMFVASVMLWYVFIMSGRGFVSPCYLGDWFGRLRKSTHQSQPGADDGPA
jgi:4-amino-4-deoxy-L-arabinose transferase-like glycosyltransferase